MKRPINLHTLTVILGLPRDHQLDVCIKSHRFGHTFHPGKREHMINSISCTYEVHTPNKSRRPNRITPRICHRGSHLRLKSTWRIQESRLLKKARQSAVATFHRPKKLISRPAKQQYFSGLYSEVDTSLLPLKYSCLVTASTHHSDHWDRRQSNSDTRDNANCYTTALHYESAPATAGQCTLGTVPFRALGKPPRRLQVPVTLEAPPWTSPPSHT